MSVRPELEAMLVELRGLGPRDLRFTLSALKPQEQAEILELLETRPANSVSFETLAGISPWLIKRLEAARGTSLAVDGQVVMTRAAGDALNAALATLGTAPAHDPAKDSVSQSGSWLDRFLHRTAKGAAA